MPVKKESTKLKSNKKVTAKQDSLALRAKIEKAEVAKPAVKAGKFSVPMFNLLGKSAGTLELPKAVFGEPVNKTLLSQALRIYLNNQMSHNAHTKTRGEVRGSSRKIGNQKGGGRARHGSIRAPIYVGGGVAFGPKSRKVVLELPKKMKKAALISALVDKFNQNQVMGVTGLEKATGKTGQMHTFYQNVNQKNVLIVSDENLDLALRATKNLKGVSLKAVDQISVLDIVKFPTLMLTAKAAEKLASKI